MADDSRFRCFAVPGVRDLNCPAGRSSVPRNIALKKAAGELICFLDVDDLWHPSKLERQVRMHVGERLDLSVTAYYRWSWRTPVQLRWICPPRRLTAWSWRWGNPIPMLTVMVSREALRLLQQPNNALFESVHHEDYLFWLRLAHRIPSLRFGCIPEGLAIHRRFPTTSRRSGGVCLYGHSVCTAVWSGHLGCVGCLFWFGRSLIVCGCVRNAWVVDVVASVQKQCWIHCRVADRHCFSGSSNDLILRAPFSGMNQRQ